MRRRLMFPFAGLAALLIAGGTQAAEIHAHHLSCSFDSDYDLQVEANGIVFSRNDGHPRDIFMHDGQLRVDGQNVAVSQADAARLREYEQQVRELMPAVAAVAREGVDIGYAALTTVVATLSENGDERSRLLQELRDRRSDALRQIDASLGHGRWKAGDASELIDHSLESTVTDLVGEVTGDVVKDALSGDSNRLAALQARTDALDATLDKAIDAPAEKLGQRAEALCPGFSHLERLQGQFQFRLADGNTLQLISPDKDRSDKARQYADR